MLLALGGLALYLLLPSLLAVFGAWRSLSRLNWPFALLALTGEIASFACLWQVDRIVLHTRAWFPVVAAQLTATSVGHLIPGGPATATAAAAAMLRRAGIANIDRAVGAYGAAAGLQLATTFALPLFALPAIGAGAPVERSLQTAALLAMALLAAVVATGLVAFLTNTPVALAGRGLQKLVNATVRRRRPVTGLATRLLSDRDAIRAAVGANWKTVVLAAAGNTVLDYLALLAALHAVDANPQPALILLAYTMAELLALLPFTPGGIGFVEGGLVATITLAGVPVGHTLTAVLLYRLVSFWLPLAAGGIAYLLFRHRYGPHSSPRRVT